MNTNDALTTTATQVETILTHHSVTYTTTDNRGKEEDDYRITVGDVTAYLTASDDGDVWATTDENPADAYDGPANVDEIALHLVELRGRGSRCCRRHRRRYERDRGRRQRLLLGWVLGG